MASSTDERESREIRLVLLGKSGAGKSATGNTILKIPNAFESKNSAQSVTKRTGCKTNVIDDVYVKVIDTPGFFDTEDVLTKEDVDMEVVKCVGLSSPGPHAFLYVVDCGRLTKEDIETAEKILELFGNDIFNFMILVLVIKIGLDDGQTIEEYIDSCPIYFKRLLHLCKGRRLVVNNKGTDQEKNYFVSDLLNMVTTMNISQHYYHRILQNTQVVIENRITELSRQNPSLPRRLICEMIDKELLTGEIRLLVLLGEVVGNKVGGFVAAAAAIGGAAGGAGITAAKHLCTIL